MAVRLRLKKLGRRRRPFFRVCAMDARTPRDGRVIEELGHYDPMVRETDARAILKAERIDYWLGVGAQPTEKVKTLIKKYGTGGTHLEQQKAALERVAQSKPVAPPPVAIPQKEDEQPAATTETGAAAGEGAATDETSEESRESEAAAVTPEGNVAESESSDAKPEGGE